MVLQSYFKTFLEEENYTYIVSTMVPNVLAT